mmetsp:Transcript_6209/g.15884  ORF Transcript_6209/g.15884 Transcript_6209/m.15884 type:complete len:251 (+) Transcript_6209:1060-1812(+)
MQHRLQQHLQAGPFVGQLVQHAEQLQRAQGGEGAAGAQAHLYHGDEDDGAIEGRDRCQEVALWPMRTHVDEHLHAAHEQKDPLADPQTICLAHVDGVALQAHRQDIREDEEDDDGLEGLALGNDAHGEHNGGVNPEVAVHVVVAAQLRQCCGGAGILLLLVRVLHHLQPLAHATQRRQLRLGLPLVVLLLLELGIDQRLVDNSQGHVQEEIVCHKHDHGEVKCGDVDVEAILDQIHQVAPALQGHALEHH